MAVTYVNASTGTTDAGGAWSHTAAAPAAAGNVYIVQVVQDGTSASNAAIDSVTNAEALNGTDNTLTYIGEFDIGNAVSASQHLWIGRALNTSAMVITGSNAGTDDIYIRVYEFTGVAKGTTLSTVIENSTAGSTPSAAGTGTTVSDVGVTTLGADRLALNFLGFDDDLTGFNGSFTGETGGDWATVASYGTSTGTDAGLNLNTAAMASAGTVNGGTLTITSMGWGAVGFALIPELAPSVTLDSPADAGSTSDTTPDLLFTGTDGNADAIEYNVQIDTSSGFDSQIGSGPTFDTVVTANGNGTNSGAFGALTTAEANEVLICTLDFSNATPSGVTFDGSLTWTKLGTEITKPNIAGEVYHYWALAPTALSAVTFTATFTGGGFPQWSGTIQAWKGCDPVSPIGDHQTGTCNNSTSVSATVTTTRANSRVIAGTGQTGSNAMSPGSGETEAAEVASVGGFSTSNATYQNSVTSSASTSVTMDVTIGINDDMGMRAIELKATQTPLIDKVSTSDAGFTDITDGADTHPFDSGDQIQYTVQSALSVGTTYYWRARGIDPTGGNAYGSWATARSFTVVAALLSAGRKILQAVKRASFY